MDLKQLQTFRIAALELSFTRTAEMLSYAPSSVTAQIQALEEELGARLFERRGKRVTLTEPGTRLLSYAEQILRLAEEAKKMVASDDEPAGSLTIGALESLCAYRLPPILTTLQRRFPKVELTFRPGMCADIPRAAAQELDAVVTMDVPLQSPSLIVHTLQTENILLLVTHGHPLAEAKHIHPTDLQNETFLLTENGCRYRQLFEQQLAEAGVHPSRKIEFVSVEAIKQCAMSGLGIALLPEMSVAAELAQGRLVKLDFSGTPIQLFTQIVWHKDKWISPALQAFIDVTMELLHPAE